MFQECRSGRLEIRTRQEPTSKECHGLYVLSGTRRTVWDSVKPREESDEQPIDDGKSKPRMRDGLMLLAPLALPGWGESESLTNVVFSLGQEPCTSAGCRFVLDIERPSIHPC